MRCLSTIARFMRVSFSIAPKQVLPRWRTRRSRLLGEVFQQRRAIRGLAEFVQVPSLPAAGWLATITGGRVFVVCGEGVERTEQGVFEGCWDGPFEQFNIDTAENVAGSGIRFHDDRIVLVSPSHTIEGLYVHERHDRFVISNSLAFLLEHESIQVPNDAAVCRRLATVVLGLNRYHQLLFDGPSGRVIRFVNATVNVDEGGLGLTLRSLPRRFADFAGYRDHLRDTISRIADNGRSPFRNTRYELTTTVSSGYDSTACAALARQSGCEVALTLARGRSGRSDSGRPVAEALGLAVHEVDQGTHTARDDGSGPEEMFASGMGGEDISHHAFERLLAGTILVTGFHGGTAWKRLASSDETMARGDISGCSLVEFRLRVGFVHLPVPFIGALRQADIARISRSDEMRGFSVGGTYDRPIARRIAEEAGVPRELFGQQKQAVSVLAFLWPGTLPESVRDELMTYVKDHATLPQRLANALWYTRFTLFRILRLGARLARMQRALPWLEDAFLGDDYRVFEHTAPIASELTFRWALEKVRLRYTVARNRP